MGPGERLDALRASLADGTPWGGVLTRLACWPEDGALEGAVKVVEEVVDRWPTHTRGLSRMVVGQLLAGRVRPYLTLLGALDMRLLWRELARPQLLSKMVTQGGLRRLATFKVRYDRGDEIAEIVARHIVGLRELSIGASHLGTAGVQALIGSAALDGLTRLSLHNNRLEDEHAEMLLAAPQLAGLRALNLYGNRLSAGMIEKIRTAPQWAGATFVTHGQASSL